MQLAPSLSEKTIDFSHDGQRVFFHIDEPTDVVQKTQMSRQFYEAPILERLKFSIPEDAVIADIGANVGNHTVYFGLFCRARRIIAFEPNTHLQAILRRNVELNNLKNVDLSLVRFGISGSEFEAKIRVSTQNNWGNGHLVSSEDTRSDGAFTADVSVRPLDSFNFEQLDFIKADVEGHELGLIEGAADTIKRCRPTIFIEVGQSRIGSITRLLETSGYRLVDFNTMYRGQGNYLFVPVM